MMASAIILLIPTPDMPRKAYNWGPVFAKDTTNPLEQEVTRRNFSPQRPTSVYTKLEIRYSKSGSKF
jgi:hypothetical protein